MLNFEKPIPQYLAEFVYNTNSDGSDVFSLDDSIADVRFKKGDFATVIHSDDDFVYFVSTYVFEIVKMEKEWFETATKEASDVSEKIKNIIINQQIKDFKNGSN